MFVNPHTQFHPSFILCNYLFIPAFVFLFRRLEAEVFRSFPSRARCFCFICDIYVVCSNLLGFALAFHQDASSSSSSSSCSFYSSESWREVLPKYLAAQKHKHEIIHGDVENSKLNFYVLNYFTVSFEVMLYSEYCGI